MVLENSSDVTTGDDSFNENPPPSDDDPYSGSSPEAEPLTFNIDVSKLPKPIPIIGSLSGWNHAFYQKVLTSRIQDFTSVLRRVPQHEEVEAIAFWTAKQISIQSYASPVGLLGGAWRAYNTMSTFRFPFYQPNVETFNPTSFPSSRMSILRGNKAIMTWHFLRFTVYGGIGQKISQILFGSYAMSVTAVGQFSDPRMKAVKEAGIEAAKKKRGGLNVPDMPGTAGSPHRGGMGGQVDDASPTGGMFSEENGTMSSTRPGEDISTTIDDPSLQDQPKKWPQQSRPAPRPIQRAEQDEIFDPFDDASPTSGQSARDDTTKPPPQRQQGSAWDRVRQGAGKSPGGRQMESGQSQESGGWAGVREQAQSPTSSEDYAYSKQNEEKSLARDQAQKEFDARVERERRGGDFSTGSGDQKRW